MCKAHLGDDKKRSALSSPTTAIRKRSLWCRLAQKHRGSAVAWASPPTSNRTFDGFAGILVQYPTTDGRIVDYTDLIKKAHAAGAMVVVRRRSSRIDADQIPR